MDRSARFRSFFARYLEAACSLADPRIVEAFRTFPREHFIGEGPWSIYIPGHGYIETPDDDPACVYNDWLIALQASHWLNNGQPSLHARCIEALAIKEGESVIQVGIGGGYYTAILAHLVGQQGRVIGYELDRELAALAAKNLEGFTSVEVRASSGLLRDLPKVDVIYVNAGITHPSWMWLHALRPAGRLVFPLQAQGTLGGMLLVTRPSGGGQVWPARFVARAGFIACQGSQHEATGESVTTAFTRGGWEAVRSLRIDDEPDASCWVQGEGWWLSTNGLHLRKSGAH